MARPGNKEYSTDNKWQSLTSFKEIKSEGLDLLSIATLGKFYDVIKVFCFSERHKNYQIMAIKSQPETESRLETSSHGVFYI